MSAPVEVYHHPVAVRDDWETPPEFFARYDDRFHFTLDACATSETAKCARYFTKEQDGLAQDWGSETVWVNPPYGREIPKWMKKAWDSAKGGATVVMLVPSRTDSAWWHDYAMRGEVEFLRGRLRFVGAPHTAPFPCAIVVFRP